MCVCVAIVRKREREIAFERKKVFSAEKNRGREKNACFEEELRSPFIFRSKRLSFKGSFSNYFEKNFHLFSWKELK